MTLTLTGRDAMTTQPVSRLGAVPHIAAFTIALSLLAGCSARTVDRQWETPAQPADPLASARSLLKGYADGRELGSEAMEFDAIVKQVTEVDAAKGEKLRKFLTSIKNAPDPAAAAKLAKEL
jgi:hypothetical protein